ncbi:MAG: DNA repair protein RadC [Flavobacteriaceae bacterium]|jgi:DNA repair protein RadC
MSNSSSNLTIKQWNPDDRPREKLKEKGAQALSVSELLAIIIGSGSPGESAVELMKRVLHQQKNGLTDLQNISLQNLMKFKGVGMVKAIKIKATIEISKRMQNHPSQSKKQFTSSALVFRFLSPYLSLLDHEEFWILYLNQSNSLLEKKCLSKGGINQTVVDVRLALKHAIELGATSMILAHNHPSGNLKPSSQDKEITQKFIKAAATFDILILDHLIVSEKRYFSFKDENLI